MKIITQQTVRTAVMMALCVFGPAAAMAQQQAATAAETRTTKVSLAGLDVSTPEGMIAARTRLRDTAVRLCSQVADELDLSHHANFVKCVDATVTSALQQLTGPMLAGGAAQPSASKPAAPVPAAVTRAETVSLADLDLSTPEGARAAHERLHQVASTLCFAVGDPSDLSHVANFYACVDDAMARALPRIEELASKNAPPRSLVNNLSK